MTWWRNLHLFGKICLILAGTLSLLFAISTRINQQQQTNLVLAEAVEKARLVSFTAIRTREYLSNEIALGGIELSAARYGMIPAVASTRVGGIIGEDIGYSIRQIATRYRNPENKPDTFEAEILSRMEQDRTLREYWQIDRSGDHPVFRYLQPFNASESCLECHGDPERAPAFIKELFPQEKDNAYHYQLGEVIGAVSVSIPLAGIDAQIAALHRTDILISAGLFGALLLFLGLMIRHTVTYPLASVSLAIRTAVKTGRFGTPLPRRGRDEIGQLIDSFNEMAIEVQTKNDHLAESERRYRILTDTAHDAIISFLPAGQIICNVATALAVNCA